MGALPNPKALVEIEAVAVVGTEVTRRIIQSPEAPVSSAPLSQAVQVTVHANKVTGSHEKALVEIEAVAVVGTEVTRRIIQSPEAPVFSAPLSQAVQVAVHPHKVTVL